TEGNQPEAVLDQPVQQFCLLLVSSAEMDMQPRIVTKDPADIRLVGQVRLRFFKPAGQPDLQDALDAQLILDIRDIALRDDASMLDDADLVDHLGQLGQYMR